MSSNRSMDRSLIIPDNAIDDSPVSAVYTVFFDLFCNKNMTLIIFADNQRACGIHINSMHNTGTQYPIDSGKTVLTMIHQCIDQCSAAVACRRMYDHPLWLIDDQKIIILVQNIKRNVFWLHVQFFRFRQKHQNGITGGIGDGLFGPNQPCTRAQIVTFLWRAAGSPAPKGTAKVPADVLPGSYCYDAVAWALENGIINGLADGTFGVNNTCTRGQSVTFLYRAMGTAPTTVNGFTDVAADSFCADAVAWAVENGVTNGTSATTFSPNNGCTRAQIVTFLYRAYQGK